MAFIKTFKSYLLSFSNLIYPNFCVLCQSGLHKNEITICTICEDKLPYTNDHLVKNNPIEKKLWGRVYIEKASSLLFFEKGLDVQTLISNLKYKNREDVGAALAKIYSRKLLEDKSEFLNVDLIIPIPLHFKKKKRRGYNQCDLFAQTLSEEIKVPFDFNVVKRNVDTISQTGKSRIKRWENVANIFEIVDTEKLLNKHILLVDDVLTTGATLEAVAIKILSIEGTKLSVIVMASAL